MNYPAFGPYEVAIIIDEEGKARGRNGERWVLIRNAEGAIASVYPGRDAEATANLLAASWDMLEACRIALATLYNTEGVPSNLSQARVNNLLVATIAKAEGRQ